MCSYIFSWHLFILVKCYWCIYHPEHWNTNNKFLTVICCLSQTSVLIQSNQFCFLERLSQFLFILFSPCSLNKLVKMEASQRFICLARPHGSLLWRHSFFIMLRLLVVLNLFSHEVRSLLKYESSNRIRPKIISW